MRAPRIRVSLRQMMIAAAVIAVLMAAVVGLQRRAAHLRALGFSQSREASRWERPLTESSVHHPLASAILEKVRWHDAMAARYERAARAPWRLIEPAPPAPPAPELPEELAAKYRLGDKPAPRE
jgi:hypothetical protein